MADVAEMIYNYNPTGYYLKNRKMDLEADAQLLNNQLNKVRIEAANRENDREKKIMDLQDAWANGNQDALRQIGIYSPETSKKYIDNEEEMLNIARPYAQAIMQAAPENREKIYQQTLQSLRNKNIDVSDMPQYYDEGVISTLANADPVKIQQERQAELQRQAQQEAFNRQIGLLNYQRSMANKDKADQINYVESLMEAGKISPEKGLEAISAIKGVSVTPQTAAEVALDDYLKTGNPESLEVIKRQGEAARLLSTKNTSDSAYIQANREYSNWEAENPNATEEEKRDMRFSLNIPNGTDKAWLEQEKQRAKDNQGFLIGNGYAKDEEEANQLMGVNNTPVGQALSQEAQNLLNNPLMADKNYRATALKKQAEADFKRQQKIVKYNENKAKIMPLLLEAYDAAKDGTGIGPVSGRITKNIYAKGKAARNATALTKLDNAMSPAFISSLSDAGGSSRTIDANKEMEKYIPMLDASTPPEVLAEVVNGIAQNLFGTTVEEYRNQMSGGKEELPKEQPQEEVVIDFTEYFGE